MSLAKHTAANLLGATLPLLVALLTVPVYLRLVGAERFGVMAVIWAILGYFGFLDLGFGRAVTQRLARMTKAPDQERSRLVWTGLVASLALGAVGSIVLYATARVLLGSAMNMSDAAREEAVAASHWLLIALPLILPAPLFTGALQARLRFIEANVVQAIGTVLAQLLPLATAAAGAVELQYLVPAVLASRAITTAVLYMKCRTHIPMATRPQFDAGQLRSLLGYGGWISVMNVLAPLLVTVDRAVIASLSGARSVAHYTVPYDLVSRAMIVPGSLASALFPRLAQLEHEHGRLLAGQATSTLVAVMTPFTLLGIGLIHPFLALWVGREFAQGSRGVGEIILAGVWLNALVVPHHARFLATESPKRVALIFLAELPVYLMMLWIGVALYGVLGAAVAWSLRVLLDTVLLLRLNGVLAETARTVLCQALTVCACLAFVLIDETNIATSALLLSLVLVSLYVDRSIYASLLAQVRGRSTPI